MISEKNEKNHEPQSNTLHKLVASRFSKAPSDGFAVPGSWEGESEPGVIEFFQEFVVRISSMQSFSKYLVQND